MKLLALFLIGTLAITSCKSGLELANSSYNSPLPPEFKSRSVYPNDLAGGLHFEDLVGSIVYLKKNNDPLQIGLIRPSGFISQVTPITDPNTYYKSRIKKGAEAGGSYLTFAASLSAEQMVELELVDAAWSGILFKTDSSFNQILTKAQTWVNTHPKTDTAAKRIWIKEVVLTRRFFSAYSNIKANAKGVVGPTVGVNGGIYNNNDVQTKSIMIGLVAYDIDKMVANSSSQGLAGKADAVLSASTFPSTEIQGTFKKAIQ